MRAKTLRAALAALFALVALACAPGPAARAASANPFAGAHLWVDPDSEAARQVRVWRATRPGDVPAMDKIAVQPLAAWFDHADGLSFDLGAYTRRVARAGALALIVAYYIPHRDCGSYSQGGARSASGYRGWVRAVAGALHGHRAAVILEPDGLAEMGCLNGSQRREREALLRYAGATMTAHGVSVYIDAGNAGWLTAATMAARLRAAGIARVRGFALNVSNFDTTASETAYGHRISALVGGKPFVIDTSRNGRGPAPHGVWCNPAGRGLGSPPTAATGDPVVDAHLWIKAPGESDGSCAGGPPAGVWWPAYALGLAQRAAF